MRPLVQFASHKVSEIVFTFLLYLYTSKKSGQEDCLGMESFNLYNIDHFNRFVFVPGCPPTAIEWVILLWIVGKLTMEIQELKRRGIVNYFQDVWNYPDLALLALFFSSIILRLVLWNYALYSIFHIFIHFPIWINRIVDFQINDPSTHTTRIYWPNNTPRLWAENLLSWAYIMVFIRLLEILEESRNLGNTILLV